MPRKSVAALTITSINQEIRLNPPATLTETERSLFLQAVNAKPSGYFDKSHLPLLVLYVRHLVYGEVIRDQITAMQTDWLTTEDGLKRYDKLLAMHEREGRAASSLATRLRLTPQSIYSEKRAADHKSQGPRPWDKPGDDCEE